jgi:SH3-like domain-containing protein
VRYLAEPGVVGRISDCTDSLCRMRVGGRSGYISRAHFWGADPGEDVD